MATFAEDSPLQVCEAPVKDAIIQRCRCCRRKAHRYCLTGVSALEGDVSTSAKDALRLLNKQASLSVWSGGEYHVLEREAIIIRIATTEPHGIGKRAYFRFEGVCANMATLYPQVSIGAAVGASQC